MHSEREPRHQERTILDGLFLFKIKARLHLYHLSIVRKAVAGRVGFRCCRCVSVSELPDQWCSLFHLSTYLPQAMKRT